MSKKYDCFYLVCIVNCNCSLYDTGATFRLQILKTSKTFFAAGASRGLNVVALAFGHDRGTNGFVARRAASNEMPKSCQKEDGVTHIVTIQRNH